MVIGNFGANRSVGVASLIAAASIGLAGFAHADTDGQMYGDPQAAAPYWRIPFSTSITGREPAQPAIVLRSMLTKSEAHRGAIYRFDGTSPEDLVVLLQKFGIESDMTNGNTMPALEQDLAGGHKVIAGVNAETLWNTQGQRTDVDHAVVDTRADIVHL